MRLRRSHINEPGIARVRRGKGFAYCHADRAPIDGPTLERIEALAIPPAWTEVWICPFPNGHIQAVGLDAAGRRQYRYHDAWTKRRDEEKFADMVEFARALPEFRSKVADDLAQEGLPKARVLALGVRLLDVGMFRIGGEQYANEHETYGLATIEKRHLQIKDGIAYFDYTAKGGKRRQIAIADPAVIEPLKQLKARKGGENGLLAWREGRQWVDVSSHDVNTYIKERSGGDFTAKDFRTWDATLLAAVLCAQAPQSKSISAKKRCIARILREVSDSLGNTPAVCRKSYVDPRILDNFDGGETICEVIADLSEPVNLHDQGVLSLIERAVISMLSPIDALAVAA